MATINRGVKSTGGTGLEPGATIIDAELDTDFDTAYNAINGNLDDANIAAAADIDATKLAPIGGAAGSTVTAAEFRAEADGDLDGAGAVPTDMEGEIQRIRKVLADMSGQLYWYNQFAMHAHVRGYIDGFTMSTGTVATTDVDIVAGTAVGSGIDGWIRSTANMEKQIDVNWAEGDDQGGFPSGLTLAELWYHVFVIAKTDGTMDAGFDTSLTAANLLTDASDYTYYRRVGSVLTGADPFLIIPFKQFADRFTWDSPPQDINNSAFADTLQTETLSTPLGVRCLARFTVVFSENSTSDLYFFEADHDSEVSDDLVGRAHLRHVVNDTEQTAAGIELLTGTSSEIHYRGEAGNTNTLIEGSTLGWTDYRGRS